MQRIDGRLVLAATDLSSFLACRHRTGLDMAVADRRLVKPSRTDAFVAALQQKGQDHERRYVEALRAQPLRVVDIGDAPGRHGRTLEALTSGADVIVQAALRDDGWRGYADILRRVEKPSALGGWSYEASDTKLARETRGGTILQLALYSDLLARVQGVAPESFHVITPHDMPPHHLIHSYRVADFAAYYRQVRAQLLEIITRSADDVQAGYYPEPVEHCEVCHWWDRCNRRRRHDDHLAFIAHIGRGHRMELVAQGIPTLAAAARMPVPLAFRPRRGSADTYERLAHQARVQHEQRASGIPRYDLLPVQEDDAAVREGPAGLRRLPAPSPGDIFLDLEGARFAREGGREYLFGYVQNAPGAQGAHGAQGAQGALSYQAAWAFDDASEKAAFESVIDAITRTLAEHPDAHVYHFNHYEPTAFKRLMGRHATRADELDALLRGERFVDLYTIVRQALRAGVESYSIKQLEQYYGFRRDVDLRTVSAHLQALELALEGGARDAITGEMRDAVQGYNRDDCHSTLRLRDWLESLRSDLEEGGQPVPRPVAKDGAATDDVAALQLEVEALRAQLLDGLAPDASVPAHADHARWLLAYLIDWHKREDKAQWWEYFRLRDLPEEELLDEPRAVAGLTLMDRVDVVLNVRTGRPTGSVVDRYRYPAQDVDLGRKAKLKLPDGSSFGDMVAHDRQARTIDVRKGPTKAEVHPHAAFDADVVSTGVLQRAVMRSAEEVLLGQADGAAFDLLHRRSPRLSGGVFTGTDGAPPSDVAVRIVGELDRTTLAIQGPPGAGKTYVGARMIRALVAAGRRVGVTAVSHKVIINLMEEVAAQASLAGEAVRLARKVNAIEDDGTRIRQIEGNDKPLAALVAGEVDVLGGTAWLWAREDYAATMDVLFVDEAGQMSLANALAVSQAARSLVLLGDPQQLEQPQKGSHPDGVSVSALQHVIGEAKTMPPERGLFMDETWRLAPAVCRFTSELFYEGQLRSREGLERQRLAGAGRFDGAGLWWVPVEHDGNRNASDDEVDAVARIIDELLGAEGDPRGGAAAHGPATWIDADGTTRPLTPVDVRIVAPFNAQVNRLTERVGERGIPIGTVDRFQGQTAVAVIYSMATSRPEDAPRGMEFLYSLNRLNVATSRARCAAIIVASPRLLEPDCRTPRQMQLANALCRFREMTERYSAGRIVKP